jgi:hypothetical protein
MGDQQNEGAGLTAPDVAKAYAQTVAKARFKDIALVTTQCVLGVRLSEITGSDGYKKAGVQKYYLKVG